MCSWALHVTLLHKPLRTGLLLERTVECSFLDKQLHFLAQPYVWAQGPIEIVLRLCACSLSTFRT